MTVVMLKGKKARDCDDAFGEKMQATATMLLKKYGNNWSDVVRQNMSDCDDVVGEKSLQLC